MRPKGIAILTMAVLFCTAARAGHPDFSGTWNLNEAKSSLSEGGRRMISVKLAIVQQADSILVERVSRRETGEERISKEKMSLDGKPCDTGSPERPRTSAAVWSADGKFLVVNSTSVFERDGNRMEIKSTESWTLSGEGKVLTIELISTSPRGERKATLVYDKG
jgi:hypothetical protein